MAVIVSYRMGAWTILAKNGTKVAVPFNITVFPRAGSTKVIIRAAGETITRNATWGTRITVSGIKAGTTIHIYVEGVHLAFRAIAAQELQKEAAKNIIKLTVEQLKNLKLEYVVVGAALGCIAVANAWMIRRKALLVERRAALALAGVFVIIAFFANYFIWAYMHESAYYWLIYATVLIVAVTQIPPPRGIWIIIPELSKRNVNLDYVAVYRDRRGLPRVAEQDWVSGLRRLLGRAKDPVLVNGVTRETMSLIPSWTLNYEEPLVIAHRVEFSEIELEGDEDEED